MRHRVVRSVLATIGVTAMLVAVPAGISSAAGNQPYGAVIASVLRRSTRILCFFAKRAFSIAWRSS